MLANIAVLLWCTMYELWITNVCVVVCVYARGAALASRCNVFTKLCLLSVLLFVYGPRGGSFGNQVQLHIYTGYRTWEFQTWNSQPKQVWKE